MTAPFHPASRILVLGGPTCLQLKHDDCPRGIDAALEYDRLVQGGSHAISRAIGRKPWVFWDVTRGNFVRVTWKQKRTYDGRLGPKMPCYTTVLNTPPYEAIER